MSRLIHRLGIAVVFALALAMAVPCGAVEEPEVPAGEARLAAAMAFVEHVGFEVPFTEEWRDASLGDPTLLYDPDGTALFYEFPVLLWGELDDGCVVVAATPLHGSTFIALQVGARELDMDAALEEAAHRVGAEYPGHEVVASVPVVYQYPKVGVMVEHADPEDGGLVRTMLSLPDLEPIEEQGDGEPGTVRVVSMARQLAADELAWQRIDQYQRDMEAVLEAWALLQHELEIDPALLEPVRPEHWAQLPVVLANMAWNQQQVLALDVSRLKLIKQETPDWCARAVAQMIEHYNTGKVTLTQKQIDTILKGYGWTSATWEASLVKFYKVNQNMAYSALETNLTTSTAADAAKQQAGLQGYHKQIRDGFPFSDNIYGHARMGVGYRMTSKLSGVDLYEIGIYDPAITGGGVRWELGWTDGMLGLQTQVYRVSPVYVRNTP